MENNEQWNKILEEVKKDTFWYYIDNKCNSWFKSKYCICNKTNIIAFKIFSLISRWITIYFWILFVIIVLLSPFFLIVKAFASDKEELLLNNNTYYEIFTEINEGIKYELDKTKLAYTSIILSIILTLNLGIFIFPCIYKKMKALVFLIIFLFLNICSLILDVFVSGVILRMNNSFQKYQYTINVKYAEKGEYIFPYDEIDNKSYGIIGLIFYFFFIILYNMFIVYMYNAKRIFEKRYNNNISNKEQLNPSIGEEENN